MSGYRFNEVGNTEIFKNATCTVQKNEETKKTVVTYTCQNETKYDYKDFKVSLTFTNGDREDTEEIDVSKWSSSETKTFEFEVFGDFQQENATLRAYGGML